MKIPLTFLVVLLAVMDFSSPLVQGEKLDGRNSLVVTLRGIKAVTRTTIHGTTTSRTDEKIEKEENSALKSLTSHQINDVAPLHGTQASGFTSTSPDIGPGSNGIDSNNRHINPCCASNYKNC